MRPAVHAFAAHTTRGPSALVGLTTVTLLSALGLLANLDLLTATLSDVANLALTAMLVAAPLAAASGAWITQRLLRSGQLKLARTTPRGGGSALSWPLLANLAWSGAAYAAFLVVVCLRVGRVAFTLGGALLVILSLLLLVVATLMGSCVARFLTSGLGPVLAAALVAAPIFIAPYLSDTAAAALPSLNGTYWSLWQEPGWRLVIGKSTVALSVSALAIVALPALRTQTRLLAATLSVAMTVSAVVLLAPTPRISQARASSDEVCDTQFGLSLCLWPHLDQDLGDGLAALRRTAAVAEPLLAQRVPRHFAMPGLPGDRRGGAGAYPLETARGAGPDRFMTAAIEAVLPAAQCPATAVQQLRSLIYSLVTGAGVGEGSEIAALPAASQRQWVAARLADIDRSCPAGT